MISEKNNTLRVTLIQTILFWENKEKNRHHFEGLIKNHLKNKDTTDLIVLPEMFNTGFSMNPEPLAESMEGETVLWMKHIAKLHGTALCGSIIIAENGKYFNRFIFVHPEGNINCYDKKHLFAFAGEDKKYTAGNRLEIINYKGWKISPFICYDLRFPVWSRKVSPTDLYIYVANWPERRIQHWKALLPARAIENQSFLIGLNRIGEDDNSIIYNGQSCVFHPSGETLLHLGSQDCMESITLNKNELEEFRFKLPFWQDADAFRLD